MDLFTAAKSVPIKKVFEYFSNEPITKKGNVKCIFHKDDKHPSMKLYEKNNTFYCFACKAAGTNIDLVKQLTQTEDAVLAAKKICEAFHIDYEKSSVPTDSNYKQYVKAMQFLAKRTSYSYLTEMTPNQNYFQERGLSNEVIQEYELGYCPNFKWGKNSDFNKLLQWGLTNKNGEIPFNGRYIIPIKNSRGDIAGFAGRSVVDGQPKYINTVESPYFCKSKMLYNYNVARHYAEIYVVEGFLDALSLIEAGLKNVVALMGVSLNAYHIQTMLKGKTIILALDNDNRGREATNSIIQEFKHTLFKVVKKYNAKDFNELLVHEGKEAVLRAAKNTMTGPDFVISFMKEQGLSSLETREKLWLAMAKLIGSEDTQYQQRYPINPIYTPVAFKYYWKSLNRLVNGKE